MERKNRMILAAVMFVVLPVAVVFPAGQVEFAETPSDLNADYVYDTQLAVTENVVVSQDNLFASYQFGITAGTGGTYDPRSAFSGSIPIDYFIYDDSTNMNIIYDVPDAPSADNYLTGFLTGDVTVPFDVVVPQGQLVEPGLYQDTVQLRLYQSSNLRDEATWSLGFDVQGFISVAVVPVGGTFDPANNAITIDFGTLEEDEVETVEVLVLANLPYDVTVTSANDGAMAIQDLPGDTSVVPYTLRVDSVVADLSSGAVLVASGTGPTPLSGAPHTFEFTIGSTDPATSGDYEDVLTVTVTAQ